MTARGQDEVTSGENLSASRWGTARRRTPRAVRWAPVGFELAAFKGAFHRIARRLDELAVINDAAVTCVDDAAKVNLFRLLRVGIEGIVDNRRLVVFAGAGTARFGSGLRNIDAS